jgi:tetratricopeptide (TPR) repeat protein
MIVRRFTIFVCFLALFSVMAVSAGEKTALELFHAGEYEKALAAVTGDSPAALALQADILTETGRDKESVALLTNALEKFPNDAQLLAARGDAFCVSGLYPSAIADYRQAVDGLQQKPLPGQMRAKLALARLYGQLANRNARLDQADWFFDYYLRFADDSHLTRDDAYSIGSGAIIGDDLKNGIKVAALAQKLDPNFLPAFILVGETFLTKYQYPDAEEEFKNALKLNPRSPAALVGMAQVAINKRDFDSAGKLLDQALSTNPRYSAAFVFQAWLELLDEHPDRAAAFCEQALTINPVHPEALALKGSLAIFAEDQARFDGLMKNLLETCALSAETPEDRELIHRTAASRLYYTVSETLSTAASCKSALKWARLAAATDPENALAQSQLATCLMRNGLEDEAIPALNAAFRLDPFNVWIYNLKMLAKRDQEYKRVQTGKFLLKFHERDADILSCYVEELAGEQLAFCEKLYGYEVPETVKLSVMKSHADFSARISGLPRIDASGATTGYFLALPSPGFMQGVGQPYNWESTLLHELAHVVTLQGSDFRIPRWLTEGMSVYAEGATPIEWDIPFKSLVEHSRFPDLREWNRDFTRPKDLWMIPASYRAAGIFVGKLREKYGEEALPKLVRLYREKKTTPEVFTKITGQELPAVHEWLAEILRAEAAKIQSPVIESDADRKQLEDEYAANPGNHANTLRLLRLYAMHTPDKVAQMASFIEESVDKLKKGDDDARLVLTYACSLKALSLIFDQEETARNLLKVALQACPDDANALYLSGLLAAAAGENDKAVDFFRQSLASYPRFADDRPFLNPYRALFHLLMSLDKKEEAAALLSTYCAIRRDDAPAARRLTGLYVDLEKFDLALASGKSLLGTDPYRKQDHLLLAEIYEKLLNPAAAEKEKAIAGFCKEEKEPKENKENNSPEKKTVEEKSRVRKFLEEIASWQ